MDKQANVPQRIQNTEIPAPTKQINTETVAHVLTRLFIHYDYRV